MELSPDQLDALRAGLPPDECRPLIRIGALVDLPDCY
jgi:hypothetical protein